MNRQKSSEGARCFIRLGGLCSMIQSVMYIIAVIALSATPILNCLTQSADRSMEIFMAAYAANPWPVQIMGVAFILLGLLGVAVVAPATAIFLEDQENGWLTAGRHLGMLCLAVFTVYFTWYITVLPAKAKLYMASETAGRLLMTGVYNSREPFTWVTWFMFAGMGLWVAAVGSAARKHPKLPKGFLVVCAVKACGFWLAHVGIVIANVPLVIAGAVGGGLIGGPVYHAWVGFVMYRTSQASTYGREK